MMFSTTNLFSLFALASSVPTSLRGASLTKASEESKVFAEEEFRPMTKVDNIVFFDMEVFDPVSGKVFDKETQQQVFDEEVIESETPQVFDEEVIESKHIPDEVIEANVEGDLLVFGEEEFVLRCANEEGVNPCGPGRACRDIEDGITCEDIPSLQGCPAGCAPNSSCVKHENYFTCECDTGFFRPNASLGCIKMAEGEIQS